MHCWLVVSGQLSVVRLVFVCSCSLVLWSLVFIVEFGIWNLKSAIGFRFSSPVLFVTVCRTIAPHLVTCHPSIDRQLNHKPCAPRVVGFRADAPAMLQNYALHDRQTETRPFASRRKVWLKQSLKIGRLNSVTGVSNFGSQNTPLLYQNVW